MPDKVLVYASYNDRTKVLTLEAPTQDRSGKRAPEAHRLISKIAHDGIVDPKRRAELEEEGYNPHEIPVPLFRNRRRRYQELRTRVRNDQQFRSNVILVFAIGILAAIGFYFS